MTLSVVIPHYGDPRQTMDLVSRLQEQSSGTEIIVVDDASPTPFPDLARCTVVRRQVNGGYGAAVNSGMAVASGDLALLLNSDLQVGPSFIEDLVSSATPWMPAIVSPEVRTDGRVVAVGRRWPTPFNHVIEWLLPLARFRSTDLWHRLVGDDVIAWRSSRPLPTDWVMGACWMVPTDDFRAVGGFDERYFMNCEEVDLQRRLVQERGLRVIYLPKVVVIHAGGGSSDPARRIGWVVDARFRYFAKWGGAGALLVGLTSASIVNVMWNGLRQVAGRDTAAVGRFRQEMAWIRHGWTARHGLDRSGQEAT